MMKGLLLLLIASFNTNRMGSKYLLVQLEDASDEEIKATSGLAGTLVSLQLSRPARTIVEMSRLVLDLSYRRRIDHTPIIGAHPSPSG